MNKEEKENLIRALQEHVNSVSNLQFGNHAVAEYLSQRTNMLALKYFPDRTFYTYELGNINFYSPGNSNASLLKTWEEAHRRLLIVSQSMLDELQLPPAVPAAVNTPAFPGLTPRKRGKIVFSGFFLLFSSFALWFFNTWIRWNWLTNHPKRIALYLSFQLALIFTATLLSTENRQARLYEWLGIAFAIASGIISFVA